VDILEILRSHDTCLVSNAIETFNVRMRNDGYVHDTVRCIFPELPPVAGYAVTARIRTSAPPIANLCYYHRTDFWQYIASRPGPKLLAVEDADRVPGIGALLGEIHARIAKSLGCVGYISNGTVRDVAGLQAAGFQCFASGLCVSHSYAHVIEFGEPVEIGGLRIQDGDLLHGDCHGVQLIPAEVIDRLPQAIADIQRRERDLIGFCQSPRFSLERLVEILQQDEASCEPPKPR